MVMITLKDGEVVKFDSAETTVKSLSDVATISTISIRDENGDVKEYSREDIVNVELVKDEFVRFERGKPVKGVAPD